MITETLPALKLRFEEKLYLYLQGIKASASHIPDDLLQKFPDFLKAEKKEETSGTFILPSTLLDAMDYTLVSKAKRLRPLIVYSTGTSFGASLDVLDSLALCAEMTHVISLIYDDLPSFDNDDLRHGKPSCHLAFSESTAILTAYSMTYLTFEILAQLPLSGVKTRKLVSLLSSRIGYKGLALGEFLDLECFSKTVHLEELNLMYALKTAKLFVVCALMGAVAGTKALSHETFHLLEKAMLTMGVAFQIQDDLRNYNETAESLGKNPHSDAVNQKPTIPGLIGVDEAHTLRDRLLEESVKALDRICLDFSLLKETMRSFVKN